MRPFDYIMVIVSVIIGLTLTQFTNIVSFMVKDYEVSVIHGPYLCMLILGFITCLNHWTVLYKLRDRDTFSSITVAILFISGMLIYATSIVATPGQNFDNNYQTFYYKVLDKMMIMMICFILILIAESIILKIERKPLWYYMVITFILLLASGILVTNNTWHDVLGYLLLVLQLINTSVNKFVVSDAK